ncbi:MAG: ATP-binding protein [Pseudobdellovibrionaceae bacterium]
MQVVWGPRQCGKSSLLYHISPNWSLATLDDLKNRQTAQNDPALFLRQHPVPVIIDEAQYAPNLFSQIKLEVDQARLKAPLRKPLYRLTGSQQILLDEKIKESLGGRASFFRLHNLSLSEISELSLSVEEFIFKGGWPELVVNPELSAITYLNDYIRTVMDKDVALASGVRELEKFQQTMGLLAARVGELLNFESLGREVGVAGVTLKSWVINLEHSGLGGLLRPYHSNLNKRLIKTPKFYFLDTGLAVRLQGHTDISLMMRGPAFGHIFENAVLVEILKTRDHHRKSWSLHFWRSKEQEEYDFVIRSANTVVVIDAQVAVQSAKAFAPSPIFQKDFPGTTIVPIVCTFGGKNQEISKNCRQVPVSELGDFLLQNLV